MKSFIDFMDNLPLIAKVLLALPFLDIVWVVYRLIHSVEKKNTLGIVLAILLLFIGIPFLWLADIICICVMGKVFWID